MEGDLKLQLPYLKVQETKPIPRLIMHQKINLLPQLFYPFCQKVSSRYLKPFIVIFALIFLTSCESNTNIVNDVVERDANEIIVFLASQGVNAVKVLSPSSNAPGGVESAPLWSISVPEGQMVEAMAILNRNGLPRKKAPTLLELFSKQGLISSDKEETIRYQAGLAAQIAGVIRKIDGVLDADVELSIPAEETGIPGTETTAKKKITAAVYVKHQGVLDDPNSHLITKIKRLVSSSVVGLDMNDVTVIADRARFADVTLKPVAEEITPKMKEYVSIWSIVMSRASTARFRLLFFTLIVGLIIFGVTVGWMCWKFYPILRKRGLKQLFHPSPFRNPEGEETPK